MQDDDSSFGVVEVLVLCLVCWHWRCCCLPAPPKKRTGRSPTKSGSDKNYILIMEPWIDTHSITRQF